MRELKGGGARLDLLARLTESAEARESGIPAGMLELLRSELRSTPPQRVEDALGLSGLAQARRCASASLAPAGAAAS